MLKCVGNRKGWSSLPSLVKDSGWIYARSENCFVCHRPRRITIDKEKRISGAIEFADGDNISLDNSTELPKVARDIKVGIRGDRQAERLSKIVEKPIYSLRLLLPLLSIFMKNSKLALAAISYIVLFVGQVILLIRGASLLNLFNNINNRVRERRIYGDKGDERGIRLDVRLRFDTDPIFIDDIIMYGKISKAFFQIDYMLSEIIIKIYTRQVITLLKLVQSLLKLVR